MLLRKIRVHDFFFSPILFLSLFLFLLPLTDVLKMNTTFRNVINLILIEEHIVDYDFSIIIRSNSELYNYRFKIHWNKCDGTKFRSIDSNKKQMFILKKEEKKMSGEWQ